MDKKERLQRLSVLHGALRSGNYGPATLAEFRQLVGEYAAEQSRPIIEAQLAQIARRAQIREAARQAGMEAGRRAGRAELARLMARRNMTNTRR